MTLKNGKELTIRKAEKGDAAEILAYCKQVGGESDNLLMDETGLRLTVEQEAEILENANASPGSGFLVGVVDGRIVSVGNLSSPRNPRIAHQGAVALSVVKALWGVGVGSAMMQALIDLAKSAGHIEVLHLGVWADNAGGIALYKKFGFEQIGVYPKFGKINGVYHDEVLMNLYL